MPLHYTALRSISIEASRRCMNQAFSDYFVPIQLDKETYRAKLYSEGIDPGLSPVACMNNKPVGMMLYSTEHINGHLVAWNGGTGVVPSQRRRGIARTLHELGLQWLSDAGVNVLRLEVIDQNEAALAFYRKAGYEVRRELLCYHGLTDLETLNAMPELADDPNPSENLRRSTAGEISERLSWRSHQPAWQNADAKLSRIREEVAEWAYEESGNFQAWALTDAARPGLIYQMGFSPDAAPHCAIRLLAGLAERSAGLLGMLNVDAVDRRLNDAFSAFEIRPYLRQLEMVLETGNK